MKSSHQIFSYITAVGLALFFVNCKKFVEIEPPTTQLVTASVFNNSASATAAQTVIYTQMAENQESFLLEVNTGMLSDELTSYNTGENYIQSYTNAMTAATDPGPWVNAYSYIYQANAIINALQNNNAISPAIQQQLLGESKFVRAFWLFYLTNLYGDVPLVTTTNYTTNATISRTPKTDVYQQIVSDLQDAQQLLNTNYVDASDTAITVERTRPTKWAATALLARTYLYSGDFADATIQASAVIGNTALYNLNSLDSVFLTNSAEAIWQLATPLPSSVDTYDGFFFILVSAPTVCAISPQLLNSFEPNDMRRVEWVDSFATSSINYYYPFKYKVKGGSSITTATEYEMVLRLGEQYLIRAEANAQQGNMGAAINDLNVIRNRAQLQNYTGATDKNSLLSAILHERQTELFTEWGHRWFDLSRTNSADSILGSPGNVCQFKGGIWKPSDTLYPIPQSERNVDANLAQNNGY
jgi:starch-binding outer membrane protein, SusD/RagB family